jgi:hypothetical protein
MPGHKQAGYDSNTIYTTAYYWDYKFTLLKYNANKTWSIGLEVSNRQVSFTGCTRRACLALCLFYPANLQQHVSFKDTAHCYDHSAWRQINDSVPSTGGMILTAENWVLVDKPDTVPLCPPAIPQDLTWDWTPPSVVVTNHPNHQQDKYKVLLSNKDQFINDLIGPCRQGWEWEVYSGQHGISKTAWSSGIVKVRKRH